MRYTIQSRLNISSNAVSVPVSGAVNNFLKGTESVYKLTTTTDLSAVGDIDINLTFGGGVEVEDGLSFFLWFDIQHPMPDNIVINSSISGDTFTMSSTFLDDSKIELVYDSGTFYPVKTIENILAGSGEYLNYTAQASAYTATVADDVIDCTAGSFTVLLPPSVAIEGKKFYIKNSGVGTITIDGDGVETIDGALTKTVVSTSSITIVSTGATGAGWIII